MTHFKSYPFTAIVGQDEMKLALILNAINPSIGGVLIRGEKGTAKSTAARSLADLLPEIYIIADCKFNCNPYDPKECCHSCQHALEDGLITKDKIVSRKMRVVNLPINASEDRVIGTIDLKKVLHEGIKALEPGILAEANRNILYIDEVNLLADNIADLLLDAAAMGINIIEREGISTHHPAKFILIGTMNPEEGNLRPQLLDRFGLSVKVTGIKNLEQRIKIMDYVEQYHKDPVAFYNKFSSEQELLRNRINQARKILDNITINSNLINKISEICLRLGIDSHRADITVLRTAKAMAAFNGSSETTKEDIRIAVKLALEHRLKKKPFEEKELDMNLVDQILNSENLQNNEQKDSNQQEHEHDSKKDDQNNQNHKKDEENIQQPINQSRNQNKKDMNSQLTVFEIKEGMDAPDIKNSNNENHTHDILDKLSGKRHHHPTEQKSGKVTGYAEFDKLRHSNINDIAIIPTINTAANSIPNSTTSNHNCTESNGTMIKISENHIKMNRRQGKQSYSMIFCVDASGSMGVQKRMEEVKGVIMSLLHLNYIYRDKVSLVVFRDNKAEIILQPTRSVDLAKKNLEEIPTGGNTPLLMGLTKAYELARTEIDSKSGYIPMIMLISDGRTNMDSETTMDDITKISEIIAKLQIELIVIDTEDPNFNVGVSQLIAEHTGARYYHIESLNQENMEKVLKKEQLWGRSEMNADNEYNQSRIVNFVLVSQMGQLGFIDKAIKEIEMELSIKIHFKSFILNILERQNENHEELKHAIYNTDFLLLDIRGNSPVIEFLVRTLQELKLNEPNKYSRISTIALVAGNSEIRALTKLGKFDASKIPSPKDSPNYMDEIPDLSAMVKKGMKMTDIMKIMGKLIPIGLLKDANKWINCMEYWVNGYGGFPENHKYLLLYLLKNYSEIEIPTNLEIPAPKKLPPFGIYNPKINRFFTNLKEYKSAANWNESKPRVGIFFYGGIYFELSLPIVESFCNHLQTYNVLPVYSDTMKNMEAVQEYFIDSNGVATVDILIHLQYFRLNGGPFGGPGQPTIEFFKKLNIPHLNPIIQFDDDIQTYRQNNNGINPINNVIAVVMPELDGRFEMLTVSTTQGAGYSQTIENEVFIPYIFEETIELICKRVKRWLNLKYKKNSEKKIGVIVFNYPPGEDNLGNAAYLDVNRTLHELAITLTKNGFNCGTLPNEADIYSVLIKNGITNNPKYHSDDRFRGIILRESDYISLFEKLPKSIKENVIKEWGNGIGKVMVNEKGIKLPIIQFGNIYIGLQPSRSPLYESDKYHDKNLSPHHQYIAFYRYLDEILELDAIIHVGTHGTLEFLPGKESAGYIEDYNIALLGAIPHLYYYHVSNTSEGTIAKRRSNALLIGYPGPILEKNEQTEQLERASELIEQLKRIKTDSVEEKNQAEIYQKELKSIASKFGLEITNLDSILDLIERIKEESIPIGLHYFNRKFTSKEIAIQISQIIINSPLIDEEILKNMRGFDKDSLIARIQAVIDDPTNSENGSNENIDKFHGFVKDLASKYAESREAKSLIRALSCGYVEPGPGGDIMRNFEILPTGRNTFGFDPRLIPNTAAYMRGKTIADQLIERYYKEHGNYPESMAVILWAFETMKTGGESIGQIFTYLGVRPTKNKSIWTTEFEVIPLEELKRPRIDVFIQTEGIFRDTLPYVLDLINRAIEAVIELNEPDELNYVKKHSNELKNKNIEYANGRIFGPAAGSYATNLTEMIASKKWDTAEQLAENYLNSLANIYFRNGKIVEQPTVFKESVSKIAYISQIRDTAEYKITDLDHYYEFAGGLAKTYEFITKQKIPIYIADSTKKNIRLSTLQDEIATSMATTVLNKQWIDGLLAHDKHGGQKISDRLEYMIGFNALTDAMPERYWNACYKRYIEDDNIRQRLTENNRYAMLESIKTFLEAVKRKFWNATEDQIKNLKELYLKIENEIEIDD